MLLSVSTQKSGSVSLRGEGKSGGRSTSQCYPTLVPIQCPGLFFSYLPSLQMPVFHLESLSFSSPQEFSPLPPFFFSSPTVLFFLTNIQIPRRAHHPPTHPPMLPYFFWASYSLLQFAFKGCYIASQRKMGFRNMEHILDLAFVAKIRKTANIQDN